MNQILSDALDDLKDALTGLEPEGEEGFEGLLAHAFRKITGKSFRIAPAGTQHGKDGEAVSPLGHIAFEAKLYTGPINANEIISKIPKINEISGDTLDLWILGATIPINPNHARTLIKQAEDNGFPVLILDWPAVAFPPLAAALALASAETADFLDAHLGKTTKTEKARAALELMKADPAFDSAAAEILRTLSDASLGLAIALPANREWLTGSFTSKERARIVFGQPLAPGEPSGHPTLERALAKRLEEKIFRSADSDLIGVIGDEGCGKSWLLAQAWLLGKDRPLTLIITPGDLREPIAWENAESVLISKLIQQTGSPPGEASEKRWRRRLAIWREHSAKDGVRLVVIADGLNQRAEFNWPRWLIATAAVLDSVGGKLVFSTRMQHYRERLKTTVARNIHPVTVTEWSPAEVEAVLQSKGIERSAVNPAVAASLRSPRVLGIAYELLDTAKIESFQELSVGRLLFEHIRFSTRDGDLSESAPMFARRLSKHAEEVLQRAISQHRDDLQIFERAEISGSPHALSASLQAVSSEKFFVAVAGDDSRYSLTDDGLVYALALSVIDALRQAHRNKRNLSERLSQIVEPISALDKTADVLLAGLVVAGVDQECPSEVTEALIGAYVSLQNIDPSNYDAFAPVTRTATGAAMRALYGLCVSGRHVPNKEWLLSALRQQRARSECWDVIAAHLKEWLSIYSLSASIGAKDRLSGVPADKIEKEIADRQSKLDTKIQSLTAAEVEYEKAQLIRRDEVDAASLTEDAFILMAGMPLAAFSEAFVAWCFSQSINASFRTPFDEFQFLLRFNPVDWVETRSRVLRGATFLAEPGASRAAKWALVYLLRATGEASDDERQGQLTDDLVKDQTSFKGWRQVERYCETDPCDPGAVTPSNIDATAEKYEAIDMAALRQGMGMTAEDYFLDDARPGLARFKPDSAFITQRRVAADVLGRTDFPYRQGILGLEEHSVLLTADHVERFAEKATVLALPYTKEDRESRDSWISSQYTLLLILPHLSGDRQLELLTSLPAHGPSLLKLFDVVKPASADNLEKQLDIALQSPDPHALSLVLSFARFSGTPLTEKARQTIKRLALSTDKKERAFALGVIAASGVEDLVAAVASSPWSAATLDPREDYYEAWYGSSILIQAGKLGHLEAEAVLNRIAPRRFSSAANALGENAGPGIASRLNAALGKAVSINVPFEPPVVEERLGTLEQLERRPPLKSLVQAEATNDPQAAFKRLQETPDEYEARQRQGWESFNQFEAFLTRENARAFIEEVSPTAIQAAFQTSPAMVQGWADGILTIDDARMPLVHNMALVIARVISASAPQRAAQLFHRLSHSRAFVRFTYGYSAVSLEARSIWKSASHPELDALKSARLSRAATDEDLAAEVLAALQAGQDAFLMAYVDERLASEEPSVVARALTICGFRDASPHAESVLAGFTGSKGVVGRAATAAKAAYERNIWARHWFARMCTEASPEEFWRYSALFLKIVDGRFDVWSRTFTERSDLQQRFFDSLVGKMERRIKRWQNKRERSFLGDKAPQPIYLHED